ncbi:hypothetical protein WG219_06480 [Ectopseudomonas mendocina]|uniref:Lipoprotein n=1 Tax=Ectopseudomonas mendocina TaxID=300 RepID=A0ABZ2RNB4_ECTME
MNTWRALLVVCCTLLGGCLVTLKDPIPANEPAPIPLLGEWSRKNEWGEQVFIEVTRAGANVYRARVYDADQAESGGGEEYGFTVAHHGRRWYISAGLPKDMGANFAIAGFELTANNELVLYNLDVDRIRQEINQGVLQGQNVDIAEANGALMTSPLTDVFSFLDEPANADVFIEVARYQRAGD